MKISIGSRIVNGPWGGGNLFAINLSEYLLNKGHEVIYDLSVPDIDLILLTDPRSRRESSSTFNHIDINKYKELINPNVAVVQRINECDERKNTENINNLYLKASQTADHIIFVSSWLRNIYLNIGMDPIKTSVVLAGANKKVFNKDNASKWDKKNKLKLVTHHWSSHENKGFKEYKILDELLNDGGWSSKIEFTYIGNTSKDYTFENTKVVEPLSGKELAGEIKKHHVYITASENEPSGNHHIEAAQCGLPIIYKESGGIPEYCSNYGLILEQDIEATLDKIMKDYDYYLNLLEEYPFNATKMCDDFLEIFEKLINNNERKSEYKKISIKGYLFMKKIKYISFLQNFSLLNNLFNILNRLISKKE